MLYSLRHIEWWEHPPLICPSVNQLQNMTLAYIGKMPSTTNTECNSAESSVTRSHEEMTPYFLYLQRDNTQKVTHGRPSRHRNNMDKNNVDKENEHLKCAHVATYN